MPINILIFISLCHIVNYMVKKCFFCPPCRNIYFLRCFKSWQGKYGNARNYRIISPLGQEKFLLDVRRRQKVFEKIQGISLWYLQNTACTNFATEKVSVLASPGKVKDEEVGIRTIQ